MNSCTKEEVFCADYTEATYEFDEIVGALQDILLCHEFDDLQSKFLLQYCDHFENSEEQKLEYTEIFNEYTALVESYIIAKLKEIKPSFQLPTFLEELANHQNELDGEVFDILMTASNYTEFRDSMLELKERRFHEKL